MLHQATDETDGVSRFIFDRKHFAPENHRVKPRALEPGHADNMTSVYRTGGLQEGDIWQLSIAYVEPDRGKPTLARADLRVSAITRLNLRVIADNTPPRHANIADWPTDRSEAMLRAIQLAATAILVVRLSG